MRVNEAESFPHPTLANHFIQFGISTWTQDEPLEEQTESIRRAVYNADGVFSPHGSCEIPMEDMGLLVRACVDRDRIGIAELNDIIGAINESIRRQSQPN